MTADRWELFGRGCGYVALQAGCAAAIAAHAYLVAFLFGFLLSLTWAQNVRALSATCADGVDRVVYALGAGVGTVLGMAAVRWLV